MTVTRINQTLKLPTQKPDNSTWMKHLPGTMTLKDITWYGSHDAITDFELDNELSPSIPLPKFLLWLMRHIHFIDQLVRRIIMPWSEAQTCSAREQLRLGVRYLDLRIAKSLNSDTLYTVHGLFSNDTLEKSLQDIKQFLQHNPSELVILDLRRFHNMHEKDHQQLTDMLENIFTTKLAPSNLDIDSPLDAFRENDHQVIAIYHYAPYFKKNTHLRHFWPANCIDSSWPRKTDPDSLIQFITNYLQNQPDNKLSVASGVMTPTAWSIIKGILFGWIPGLQNWAPRSLADFARLANPRVEKQLTASWKNLAVNILTLDHVQMVSEQFIHKIVSKNIRTADSLKQTMDNSNDKKTQLEPANNPFNQHTPEAEAVSEQQHSATTRLGK